jgi:hypothetical protein
LRSSAFFRRWNDEIETTSVSYRTERPNSSVQQAAVRMLYCNSHWPPFLLFIIPVALFIAFFFPSFSADSRFSYRDVAFYYYPLFEQIQNEWESGRIPLWTPYVNLGQPLAGDPTASVFYPIKLVFFLSSINVLSYATCFKLYIWIHVALAFVLSYRLSRKLNTSCTGAIFAAVAYTFSGQILFQYTNVIYLVGAAWAPALFSCALDLYRAPTLLRKVGASVKLSVLQAITILGGEPQIVYLTLLTSIIIFLFVPASQITRSRSNPDLLCSSYHPLRFIKTQWFQRLFFTTAFTILVLSLSFGLAAIQILPSLELVANSQRVDSECAQSIWEIPYVKSNSLNTETFEEDAPYSPYANLLCTEFSSNGQSSSSYRFSVGPWRWLEFIFPNIGGRQFPQSSRWFNIFPEEVSVWTPTLYFGSLPFLLAISAFHFRHNRQRNNSYQVMATWIVVVSTLAAMGGFGLVWAGRTVYNLLSGNSLSATFVNYDPIGGIYWLLNAALPKFSEFRYPAKLLSLTMIGFSCLVGFGWDNRDNSKCLRAYFLIIIAISCVCLFIVTLFGDSFFSSIQTTDPLFGTFQPFLAKKVVCSSFLQTALVLSISLVIIFFIRTKRVRTNPQLIQLFTFCLLTISAADVFLANSWTIVVSPTHLFEGESELSKQIAEEQKGNLRFLQPKLQFHSNSLTSDNFTDIPPIRAYRFPVWFPPIFQNETSPERNSERVIWDVFTLFPQYPFEKNIALIDVRGAVSEKHYHEFIDSMINGSNVRSKLGFLDVHYVIGPKFWTDALLNHTSESFEGSTTSAPQLDFSLSMQSLQGSITRAAIFRAYERVDAPYLPNLKSEIPNQRSNLRKNDEYVDVLAYAPNSIIYIVSTSEPSEVVFAEQFWPDWFATTIALTEEQADKIRKDRFNTSKIQVQLEQIKRSSTVESISKPTERAFDFLRKTTVPKGLSCVIVDYCPSRLFQGAVISAIAWIVLGCVFISAVLFRPKRSKRKS